MNKDCDSYIEWNLDQDPDEQPYDCVSCTAIGQSWDIEEYPDHCPYLEEIKQYEAVERERLEKEHIWKKLNDIT